MANKLRLVRLEREESIRELFQRNKKTYEFRLIAKYLSDDELEKLQSAAESLERAQLEYENDQQNANPKT